MNRRLLVVLLAAVAVTGASFAVFACGDKTDKSTSASNAAVTAGSNGACTASMASKCPYHNSSAAVTASAAGACPHGAGVSKASGVSAVAAGMGGSCSSAKNSAAASGSCAGHGAMTSASGSCAGHKGAGVAFEAMSAGGTCGGRGIGASEMSGNFAHNCDACSDMASCEALLRTAGSSFQVVPLKNGVMYVYTAGDPRNVRAVQAAIAHRSERINALVAADNAKLCSDCKQMRGAMASGKLTREVVNIEGGSISLVTSTDPSMVARLYAMAGLSTQKLAKS